MTSSSGSPDLPDPAHVPLYGPLSSNVKRTIVNGLWGCHFDPTKFEPLLETFDPYFRFYEDHIRLHKGRLAWTTHRDILKTTDHIKMHKTMSRGSIRKQLRSQSAQTDEASVDTSIRVAVRLWLMVDVGNTTDPGASFVPGQIQSFWRDEEKFEDFLKMAFPMSHLHRGVTLTSSFNAYQLHHIGGISIVWTDNLADHLMYYPDTKAVALFHHASFLKHQNVNEILPTALVRETVDTLALLFPWWNKKVQRYFEECKRENGLDPRIGDLTLSGVNAFSSENYKHWNDRIVVLKRTFDETEPKTLYQLWHDRRHRSAWYTWWIGLTILVLTLLATIATIIQTVNSFGGS